MPRPGARLSEADCHRVKASLDDGISCGHIGTELGVNRKTIQRMKLSFEMFSAPYPPAVLRKGRPRALTTSQEDWLFGHLAARPTAEAQELNLALHQQFGIRVSGGTIYRALHSRNWLRTAAKASAAQRSEQLIAVREAKLVSNSFSHICSKIVEGHLATQRWKSVHVLMLLQLQRDHRDTYEALRQAT